MRMLFFLVVLAQWAQAARPYPQGAVAAAHPLGSEAGLEMLSAGGNAVDAAVAAAFTMAVVGPYHSGLGGGGMAVIHLRDGQEAAFDFRERAPLAARRDMYMNGSQFEAQKAIDGPLAIAVPGAVKGYLELHERFGKLPRATVLAPAIRAAQTGFVVTSKYVDSAKRRQSCLAADADAARIFLRRGEVPAVGSKIQQLDLAQTLRRLSREGAAAFYQGAIAQALAKDLGAKGGQLTLEDLRGYQTTWRTPLSGHYRGHRLLTMPPPSAGGVALLQTLGIIERSSSAGPASREVSAAHTFIEALRRVYAERARLLGDPAFTPVSTEQLLSDTHLSALVNEITADRATSSRAVAKPSPDVNDAGAPNQKNTTHISVIDRDGNAVALTTTINRLFGSCVVAKGTGVLLNDEMDDFAGQPGVPNAFGLVTGEANAIAPGKIPLSSMTPTLVFMKGRDKEVFLALGAAGGPTIPTSVMQVVSNVIDLGLDVGRAVSRGRIHHQWLPDEVWVDADGLEPATWSALENLGHHLKRMPNWGDTEAVMVDPETGFKTAASDLRNEGAPSGL